MRKAKKIVLGLIAVIVLIPLIILSIGKMADINHTGNRSEVINASVKDIWKLLDDTERFSMCRHEVDSVKLWPPNEMGKKRWTEYVGFWGTMNYEIINQIPDSLLDIQLKHSDFGMSGRWTFQLKPIDSHQTEVTIIEHSRNEGLLMRSILATLGRDANMGLLLSAIRKNVAPSNN